MKKRELRERIAELERYGTTLYSERNVAQSECFHLREQNEKLRLRIAELENPGGTYLLDTPNPWEPKFLCGTQPSTCCEGPGLYDGGNP